MGIVRQSVNRFFPVAKRAGIMKKGSVLGVWKDQAFGGDGMRATFLKTGTVNREALDLDALDEKPVTYAGGNGIVLDLAYHPVLPLAACVGPISRSSAIGKRANCKRTP